MNFAALKKIAVWVAVLGLSACVSASPSSQDKVSSPERLAAEKKVAAMDLPIGAKEDFIALYSEGGRNEVLYAMRAGLVCLREGRADIAKTALDHAIRGVEAMQEGARQAERAKSKFVAEEEKWFKGEPYERAALYFYRGLLYLMDEDFGNAAACFKRAQLQDITGEEEKGFAGDWGSCEIGLALASFRGGFPDDARAALDRLKKMKGFLDGRIPLPSDQTGVLLVVEVGRCPIKYRDGEYGERLRFREDSPSVQSLRVRVKGEKTDVAAAENLYFQATTRGARQIDYLLEGKASFKKGTDTAGDVAIVAGAVTAASSKSDTGRYAGLGILFAGLVSKGISAATHADADTRSWDSLPHSIYMVCLPANGETADEITLEGRDSRGLVVKSVAARKTAVTGKKLEIQLVRM